jgi:ParB family chromosome partitioning protein
MRLDHIDQNRLSISHANMRNGKKPPDISDILPSVRARGVLVPLLVRPNGSDHTFEIVAGRRRFFAAQTVANDTGDAVPLPCAIMEAGDDADALEASIIENCIRVNPDEVTRWENFTRLVKEGRSIDEIAATFGMEEIRVKRILALGNLLPRIRSLYAAEEIDANSIRHLTMATKAQQKAWLALYDDPNARIPRGHQLKAWLFGGASVSTKVALFDLATYKGRIVDDLFETEGYFGDADEFLAAQMAVIEEHKAAYLADGWSDCLILEPGKHFSTWEHVKTAKTKGGRVYVTIASNGEVDFHEGYVTKKEAKRLEKAQPGQPLPKVMRPEATSALNSYVDLHRHAAVRSALAAKPSVALRVTVAHIICGSHLWTVKLHEPWVRNDRVIESVETSIAETGFDERRRAVLGVLGFDAEAPSVIDGYDPLGEITAVFARLLEIPDRTVMEVLAVVMAESLASGSEMVESLGNVLGIDMANYWTADPAFFGLLRDREVMTELLREVGGDAVASANAKEKGNTIKGMIADFLTGENGRAKVEKWVPRWMCFPPSAYTPRGGVGSVAKATRLGWLSEAEGPRDPEPSAPAMLPQGGGEPEKAEVTVAEPEPMPLAA